MKRDSEKTRQRILGATRKILADKGFMALGINRIAAAAGVDKVLIYRYFGGLKGLLREMFRQGDYWPSISDIIGEDADRIGGIDPRKLAVRMFQGRARELRKRPLSIEILKWETLQKNEFTLELSRMREEQGREFAALFPGAVLDHPGLDTEAVVSLLVAGITHLVVRSRNIPTFSGVDLQSDEGWARIDGAIDLVVNLYFDHVEKIIKKEK